MQYEGVWAVNLRYFYSRGAWIAFVPGCVGSSDAVTQVCSFGSYCEADESGYVGMR